MGGSCVPGFAKPITVPTTCCTRVINHGGFDAPLILFPAMPLTVCFRSGSNHQIYQSQPAAVKASVDPDVSCPKTQVDVAQNALVETHWRLVLVDGIARRYHMAD